MNFSGAKNLKYKTIAETPTNAIEMSETRGTYHAAPPSRLAHPLVSSRRLTVLT